jgi:phosphoglycerol transferase MdoB-like AlkP superfamily enzyme
MLVKLKIPKTILWVINLFLIFLLLFSMYRLITFYAFRYKFYPDGISLGKTLPAFLLGIRYDLRWIAIILSPIIVFSIFPQLSPFYATRNKVIWSWYLAVISFFLFFFFASSFGSLQYNQTPLDAGAMNFVEDFTISMKMLGQTYPLFWMGLGLLAAVLFLRWMYHKSHKQVKTRTEGKGIIHQKKYFIISSAVLFLLIWGNIGFSPLNRAASFRFGSEFEAYLAQNPLQSFFGTMRFRKPDVNEQKAREVFPLMADWMDLPDKNNFSYKRILAPRSGSLESQPNIILFQCESFSMYKTTMSGNPLNATPFFDSLCRNGIFFSRCFTPHFATARGLFAILTGIPDAQQFKFSSRNPDAIKQHTIINALEGYDKHYFLGGSAEFNNFEGLLKNITGLQMHTQGSFSVPDANVWGISDKDLFLEANKTLARDANPFFAYIQTAGNHHPYEKVMSPGDTAFHPINVPKDSLQKYGFESLAEYNAFRYTDHCFREFFEAAIKENYFRNTIFVFVGDHGVAGNATALYPDVWTSERLTDEHVPLLFYAPYLLEPKAREEVVSQIDILPTVAGLLHISYTNTTLGRDLLDPGKKNNYAFITNTSGIIGMATDDFYYQKNLEFPDERLFIMKDSLTFSKAQTDSARQTLSRFTDAFYETAKYLIMNNRGD